MDRNLGATQVATSSTDAAAFGDLYQWGRGTDGHEKRNSGTTITLSGTDIPGHGNFIASSTSPYDWRSPQNDNLWQDLNGINNPCPSGFRLPTQAEMTAEFETFTPKNAAGAFASPLKLTMAGSKPNGSNAYWTSTTITIGNVLFSVAGLLYNAADLTTHVNYNDFRGNGFSVRCIKN